MCDKKGYINFWCKMTLSPQKMLMTPKNFFRTTHQILSIQHFTDFCTSLQPARTVALNRHSVSSVLVNTSASLAALLQFLCENGLYHKLYHFLQLRMAASHWNKPVHKKKK